MQFEKKEVAELSIPHFESTIKFKVLSRKGYLGFSIQIAHNTPLNGKGVVGSAENIFS